MELKAGKYAFVCFISDRAGGPPHVAKGMINEVVVAVARMGDLARSLRAPR